MSGPTLRGKAAVVGIGQSPYYKHGGSPDAEFKLALKAILAACEDAGIDPRRIDGFASYSNDRNDPVRLAAALGLLELRHASMVWHGGGGGVAAALGNAASAVATGLARCVVVFRALAQGQFQRYGAPSAAGTVAGEFAFEQPYGILVPAQRFAMRVSRYMHENGIDHSTLRAIAMASYHHAQTNPRALCFGKPLTAEQYDASPWIVEPFRLYDCCRENDGAAAVIVVPAEAARDFPHAPAYLLGVAHGTAYRGAASVHNAPAYGTAGFASLVPHLYEMAQVGPSDIDVVQCYENFTGGVLLAMIEHGLVSAEAANEWFTLENLTAPHGKLPINTSGGHLAEAYVHGMNLHIEAVRQLRGQSTAQVPGARVALVAGGPLTAPVSSALLGTEETLR